MNIKSTKASSPVVYALIAGLGLGIAYGVVKSFNMGLIAQLLTLGTICLIQWLIFRQGASSSYATAQSWAQAQVDIALEVTNTATAKANALSNALSMAIATANAQANNALTVNMPDVSLELINKAIEQKEVAEDATFNAQLAQMAVEELHKEELTAVRNNTDSQGRPDIFIG